AVGAERVGGVRARRIPYVFGDGERLRCGGDAACGRRAGGLAQRVDRERVVEQDLFAVDAAERAALKPGEAVAERNVRAVHEADAAGPCRVERRHAAGREVGGGKHAGAERGRGEVGELAGREAAHETDDGRAGDAGRCG